MNAQMYSFLLGYALCVMGVLGYAFGTAFAQFLDGYIPLFELNAWRYLGQVVFCTVQLVCVRRLPAVGRDQAGWVLAGGGFRWLGNVCLFQGAQYLPAGTLHAVDSCSAAFVGLIAGVITSRSCRPTLLLPFIVCVIGIILVSQPEGLGFHDSNVATPNYTSPCYCTNNTSSNVSIKDDKQEVESDSVWGVSSTILGFLLGSGSGLTRAVGCILIHDKLPDIYWVTLSFWIGIIGSLCSSLLMSAAQMVSIPPNFPCFWLLFGHVAVISPSSPMINYSAQLLPPATLTILFSGEIIFSTILQYTLLSSIHPGHRNWEEVLGIILLTIGNCCVTLATLYEVKQSDKDSYTDIPEKK